MAKDTAKKNLKSNIARIKAFTLITSAVNVVYLAFILYRNGGLPSFSDLLAIAFWGLQEYFALGALRKLGEPTLGPQGELLDCIDIADPKQLGVYSLAQDILWICWVVQTLCNFQHAFIVFYLPVPATLIYKVYNAVIKPLLAARAGSGPGADGAEANSDPDTAGMSRQERRKLEQQRRKNRK